MKICAEMEWLSWRSLLTDEACVRVDCPGPNLLAAALALSKAFDLGVLNWPGLCVGMRREVGQGFGGVLFGVVLFGVFFF